VTKWKILAMDSKERQYYLVGEVEAITYGEANTKAYRMQNSGKLELDFHWATLFCVPDGDDYKHIYKLQSERE